MNEPAKVLIAIKLSERRAALQALLESIERIGAVYQANDVQTSLELVKVHHPALVLADFEFFSAISIYLTSAVVVLAENREEQERARTAGAAQVIVEGTPVSQLIAIIESLLEGESE